MTTYKEVVKRLKKAGFVRTKRGGQTGHLHFCRPEEPGTIVTVPMHSGEISTGLLRRIAKQAKVDL